MTTKQPATAAGRALLRFVTHGPGGYNSANHDYWLPRILAIEAEAIKPWIKKYEGMRKERDLEVHKKRTARRILTERAEAARSAPFAPTREEPLDD